ncbi:hypothetical protein LCGC14_0885330 [marine sediment metagenome]|uniref:PH domain-containing protein n=1 Tax=marine sediment metagenome TaxID=412755 RepID=A0A0F9S7P2_9ZZZZ
MAATTNKQEYIDRWIEHVKEFYPLALCNDPEHQKVVTDCIDALLVVIPKIAETKKMD